MAEIYRPNIKNCGEPGNVTGPYLGSCIYEFALFIDCSAGGTTPNKTQFMDTNCKGKINTYAAGAPMNSMYTHTFSFVDIEGTPYSNPIFMGLMSEDWMAYFLDIPPWRGGSRFVSTLSNKKKWQPANTHSHFKFKHRFILMKYLYREDHWITPELLESTGGHWSCPQQPVAKDGTYLPGPTAADLTAVGVTCPNYYKLTACKDCLGKTGNQKANDILLFEMQDHSRFDPRWKTIVYPKGSKNCYEPNLLAVGPKNDSNYNTVDDEMIITSAAQKGKTYESEDSCDDCRENYLIAWAKADAIDTDLFADPDFVNSIAGVENNLLAAVQRGELANGIQFAYMEKGIAVNDALYKETIGNSFYFVSSLNGHCYKARFWDRKIGADAAGCMPVQLDHWTHYWYKNKMIYNPNLSYWVSATSVPRNATGEFALWTDACDCEKIGKGKIGNGDLYKNCYPPDPNPVITKHPEDKNVEVSTKNPTKSVTFSVTATGIDLTYQWYLNGVAVPLQTANTFTFDADLSKNHNPSIGKPYFLYCVVSNNKGATMVASNTANLYVTRGPYILFPGRTVYLAQVDIYCLNKADLLKMKVKNLFGQTSFRLPDGVIATSGSKMVYFDPDDFPVTGTTGVLGGFPISASSLEGKYWIRRGSDPRGCNGHQWTMWKIQKGVTTAKWGGNGQRSELPPPMRGVNAASAIMDESYANWVRLKDGTMFNGGRLFSGNSLALATPIKLDNIDSSYWKSKKNSYMKMFGVY